MLRFPPERRVRPPDVAGTGRAAPTPVAVVGIRAVVHDGATLPATPRYRRVGLEPAAPGTARTLAFPVDLRTPPPGTPRARDVVVANVRAVVHANPALRPRDPRVLAVPNEPGAVRRLVFDPSLVRRFAR